MQSITTLTVSSTHPYSVCVGEGLLSHEANFEAFLAARQVMIVTNTTLAPLYLATLQKTLLPLASSLETCVIPDGESHKTATTLNKLYDELLEKHFDRSAVLVALGGGVVGDLTGFAAATYRRGIDFLQIPTTLLAMVDAAIGGKTGINHPLGKNMLGAIHQPRGVIIDLKLLHTLPMREFRAGLAEVIKYGLISDPEFFQWLEENLAKILNKDKIALAYAVTRSIENKTRYVVQDEREQGARALLNLGHTFGHAIETATQYQDWLHGEAVAMGIVLAAEFSVLMGMLSVSDAARIVLLLKQAGLPTTMPLHLPWEQIYTLMALDKKVHAKKLRLILLQGIGKAVIVEKFSDANLKALLKAYFAKQS